MRVVPSPSISMPCSPLLQMPSVSPYMFHHSRRLLTQLSRQYTLLQVAAEYFELTYSIL